MSFAPLVFCEKVTAMKYAIAFTLLLVACGASNKEPAHSPESANVKAPGDAKPGDKSRCTVTGEEIDVTADSPHSEYNGKTYYFCCGGCKKKFDADPTKYTKS